MISARRFPMAFSFGLTNRPGGFLPPGRFYARMISQRIILWKEGGRRPLPKLIVVLGTTACGKSGLGVELARRFDGEIVSADSRQVYRGLDLGTGKVTQAERMGVAHHMLDVVDPNQSYSVADFQRGAYDAIDAIRARGRTPFLVGGTGLYVRAVTEGFTFADARPDPPCAPSWSAGPPPSCTRSTRPGPGKPSPAGRKRTATGFSALWKSSPPGRWRRPPVPGMTVCCWA